MPFFGHPYFTQQGPYRSPYYPSYPYHPAQPQRSYPTVAPAPFATNQPHQSGYDDLEAEERAALAHLRSIQERRDRAQAEAALLARVREEEEALRAAHARERERERQDAIRSAIAREHERRVQLQESIAREHERRAYLQQAIDREQRRAAEKERRRAYIANLEAAQKAKYEEWARRKAACAAHCAARYAKKEAQRVAKDHGKELDQLNGLLGSLFGISFVPETEQAAQPTATTAAAAAAAAATETETKTTGVAAETSAEPVKAADIPLPALATEDKPAEEIQDEKAEPAPKAADKPAFPEDINNLLSQFLGLRIEPYTTDKTPASNGGIPNGLNELLGRFGLEFEPLAADATKEGKQAEASGSTPAPVAKPDSAPAAAGSTPAADARAAPLTSFLNNVADIPPFVRDILENVEVAFRDGSDVAAPATPAKQEESEVKGKGKAVAEGEKPVPATTPVESTTTASSLDTLNSISNELDLVRASFTFPARLSFATAGGDNAPPLLFNRLNRPYHAQSNKLLQLLLQADSIASEGDKEVRRKRKEVVSAVEREIEELEKKRDVIWRQVKEKREKGEEESEDEGTSSHSSVAGDIEHVEHVEHVEHAEVAPHPAEDKANNAASEENKENGLEESKTHENEVPLAAAVEEKQEEEGKAATVVDKEEGYELL